MITAKTVRPTTDAATTYHERTGINVARTESTAHDGTLASRIKGATFVSANTTFYPVYGSAHAVYVEHFEEQVQAIYLQP